MNYAFIHSFFGSDEGCNDAKSLEILRYWHQTAYFALGDTFPSIEPCKEIQRLLGINGNPSGVKDAFKRIGLMRRYAHFFKKEIERYFKEQCNDSIFIQVTDSFDIKNPSKDNENKNTILGAVVLVFIGLTMFSACQNQSSTSSASNSQGCYDSASKSYVDSTLENEGNHPVSSSDINCYYDGLKEIGDACQ